MTDYSDGNVTYSVTTSDLLGLFKKVVISDSDGNTLDTLTGIPVGNIVTGDDSVVVLASILSGTYVSVPGSTGSIDILLNALSSVNFYIGGDTTVTIGVSAVSGLTLNVVGGTLSFSSGLVASALQGSTINISEGGTYASGSNLASVLTGSTINFGDGGGTLILNGGSTLIDLSGTSITNYDPSKDTIELQNTTEAITGYTISGSGSSRTVTLYGGSSNTEVATYTVSLASGVTLTNGTYSTSNSSNNPLEITYSDGNTYIGVCFLEGTLLRMSSGDVEIEDVRVGDKIVVWNGLETQTRHVTWVGQVHTTVRSELPDDEAGYPVRIIAGALGDAVPYKDLLVTSEHCLFLNGNFIPVRMLVNGASIYYDKSITSYDYYHVETQEHSIILANGALTESYLDTGNRHIFKQVENVISIGAKQKSWTEASAPLCVARHAVEPLYYEIAQRAKALGISRVDKDVRVLTEDPSLYLYTNKGHVIEPLRTQAGRVQFMIPSGVTSLRIMSCTARPFDVIGPYVDDRRWLGVLVGDVTLFDSQQTIKITQHHQESALSGWHALESPSMRWTEGDAVLSLGNRDGGSIGLLSIQIISAGPYLVSEPCESAVALKA